MEKSRPQRTASCYWERQSVFSHFEAQECLSSVKSSESLFDRLTDLPSLQIAMLLLRHCACPRIQFLLRTVPATSAGEAAWSHDDQVRTTLAALLGEEELSGSQWRQASLRLAVGGLGLGSARRDRIAAYLGSAADCLRNFPTNFAILGDAEEAWTDHASDTPSARCLHRCMTRLNTLLEERQAPPPPPATGQSRARLPHLCHQPRRSEEKVTTSSNFSRG